MQLIKIGVNKNQLFKWLTPQIYADANFLIACYLERHRFHKISRRLLSAVFFLRGYSFIISNLTLDETWWRLLSIKYKKDTKKNFSVEVLKSGPSVIQKYKSYLEPFHSRISRWIEQGKFQLVDTNREIINDAFNLMLEVPLSPRDAFHLAILRFRQIKGFATSDSDFHSSKIGDITIFDFSA